MSRPQINILITALLLVGVIFILANCSSSIIASPNLADFAVDVEALPIDSISKADSVMVITYADFQECVNKFVDAKAESLNQLIVMWLSIIAAICTLLPMASSFYQAWQYDKLESKLRADFKEFEDETNAKHKDNEKRQEEIRIKNCLSLLEITIKGLSDFFELGSIRNLKLTDHNHVKTQVGILKTISEQFQRLQLKPDWGNNATLEEKGQKMKEMQPELRQYLSCCIMANASIMRMIVPLKCAIDSENLIKLLRLNDSLFLHSLEMEHLYSGDDEEKKDEMLSIPQVNKHFVEIHNHIELFIDLIKGEMDSEEVRT